MSFSFDAREMEEDLVALSVAAGDFFAAHSVARVQRLARDLPIAIADAKANNKSLFSWKSPPAEPILIAASRQYKGGTADFDPLTAEIGVDYSCKIRPDGRILAEGVTVVRIKDPANDEREKLFHFDVEAGGWQETINGTSRDRAGHPAFHLQIHGIINDIPRLPSLIVHPVDVISYAILELHQKKWRQHLTETQTRSRLRKIPNRQRTRLDATLEGWRKRVTDPGYLPIVGMQRPFFEPLAL